MKERANEYGRGCEMSESVPADAHVGPQLQRGAVATLPPPTPMLASPNSNQELTPSLLPTTHGFVVTLVVTLLVSHPDIAGTEQS